MKLINTITLIDDPLAIALLVLMLVIVAKNLLGAGHSLQQLDRFNPEYLKLGFFKGSLISAGLGVLVAITKLSPGMAVTFNGAEYDFVTLSILLIYGTAGAYAKDIVTLLLKIFKQPTTVDEGEHNDTTNL